MRRLMMISAFLLASMGAAIAGPLPFSDGRYVTNADLCAMTHDQMLDKYTDAVGMYQRTIKGSSIEDGYDVSCTASKVKRTGNKVSFKAMCESEGEGETVNAVYTFITKDSFKIGERTFTRCSANMKVKQNDDGIKATTKELIDLWDEANDGCRGGSGDDPRTQGACGSREAYSGLLRGRDYCYGRDGEAGYQQSWHICGPNSNRE